MVIAHAFEQRGGADRAAKVAELRQLLDASGTTPELRGRDAQGEGVPVLEQLRPLLPGGRLDRGTVVSLPDPLPVDLAGATYLALALLAGPTSAGHWCAAVGLPDLGVAAAASLGTDLSRLLLVDEPGERWSEVVSVLAGAVDVILLRPPRRPTAEHLRRLGNRIRIGPRQRGSALIVAGPWTGAHLVLRTSDITWLGLGQGTGNLTGRQVTIAAEGRGASGRQRTIRVLLPATDGSLQTVRPAVRPPLLPEQPWARIA